MLDYNVHDDAVTKEMQDEIYSLLLSGTVDWRHRFNLSGCEGDKTQGFSHEIFYQRSSNCSRYCGAFFDIFDMFAKTAGVKIDKVLGARAFWQTPMKNVLKQDKSFYHVDVHYPHNVLLYYVNTSDGPTTLLKKKYVDKVPNMPYNVQEEVLTQVDPVKGRLLHFNGLHYHAGGIPEHDHRVIINVAYLPL